MPEEPKWGFGADVTDDGRYLVITIWRGSADEYQVHVRDLGEPMKPSLDGPVLRLVDRFESDYTLIGSAGSRLYFRTTAGAERGRIVVADLAAAGPLARDRAAARRHAAACAVRR